MSMIANIIPSKVAGSVTAPPSKSYAHRILISAFLSGEKVRVLISEFSQDIKATLGILQVFGAKITYTDGAVILERGALPKERVVCDAGESGSTLRFLLPVATALGIKAKFIGAKRLLERPMTPLISVLNEHGGQITEKNDCILVDGKISPEKYTVDGSLSSQYVTGLILALCFLGESSSICVSGKRVSSGYVDITLDVVKKFGANVMVTADGYEIEPFSRTDISEIAVEGDWSNAAFLLGAGVIGGKVGVRGLNANSRQGDMRIVDALKAFGGSIEYADGEFIATKSELTGAEIDIDKIPDLAQILSVVASYAKGKSVLKNVSRLRIKESDRVNAILYNLGVAGIRAECINDDIVITGGQPKGGDFCGFNDHRAVMSSAVLATFADGNSTVSDAQAVTKSFPTFFEIYNSIRRDD